MAIINKVEIYVEYQGAVKLAKQSGEQVEIPLQNAIPAAIQNADQFLGMGGDLEKHVSS